MIDVAKEIGKVERLRSIGFGEATFVGLAVPVNEVTMGHDKRAHVLERAERFAIGAFEPIKAAVLGGNAAAGRCGLSINHRTQLRDHRVYLLPGVAGLYVMIYRSSDTIAALLDRGEVNGLSITFLRDHVTSTLGGRSGLRTITRVEVGGVKEVAISTTTGKPAYAGTWLMRAGPAATERAIRERVEMIEHQNGDAYIPGLSNLVASRTQYRYNLKRERRRA